MNIIVLDSSNSLEVLFIVSLKTFDHLCTKDTIDDRALTVATEIKGLEERIRLLTTSPERMTEDVDDRRPAGDTGVNLVDTL